MIKVLIIEDEIPARNKLKRFLQDSGAMVDIVAEIDTVAEGISFLSEKSPDLIFSDIELLDGNSFEIYSEVTISCPIIFTTAYDKFWMNAFESNGIDYLLKPFSKERFQKAWKKYQLFNSSPDKQLLHNLLNIIEKNRQKVSFKKRFTIHNPKGIYFLNIENISYFGATEGVVFAFEANGKKHMLTEPTLKEIEEQLDPNDFFRLNRGELVNKIYVEKIEYYNKNILALKLKGTEKQLKTSQSNTARFRAWIEK